MNDLEATDVGHRTVTDAAISAFGCLTGDYSRIHFDHEFARASGLGGPIAHGLLSASWALGVLTRHAPARLGVGDPNRFLTNFSARFHAAVSVGDTLSLGWSDAGPQALEGVPGGKAQGTRFEASNQRGEVVTSGLVIACAIDSDASCLQPSKPSKAWQIESAGAAWSRANGSEPFYAEDLLERGPRGDTPGRTIREADAIGFATQMGEQNPLYLDDDFGRSSAFESCIASPMLTFCLAFAAFLKELLVVPMPSAGFAGHVGDSWRFFRPVRIGDTIRTRHKPLSCELSRSRPELAVVRFGVQLLNQRDELVQDGEIVMLIPARP